MTYHPPPETPKTPKTPETFRKLPGDPAEEVQPTDPRLDALLDEALAPADLPAALGRRILEATADRLPQRPRVLARLGFLRVPAWRAAAAVALMAFVGGALFLTSRPASEGGGGVAILPPEVFVNPSDGSGSEDFGRRLAGAESPLPDGAALPISPRELAAIQRGLDRLAAAEIGAEPIDDWIELLGLQVSMTGSASGAGVWGEGAFEAIDTAIAREEIDTIAYELSVYF